VKLPKVGLYQATKINHRRESGFYWRYKEEGNDDPVPVPMSKRLTGDGFMIAWGLSRNVLDSDLPVTLRQIKAAVYMPGETLPVAHLFFDLFRARQGAGTTLTTTSSSIAAIRSVKRYTTSHMG
jgi:hypothetical protein